MKFEYCPNIMTANFPFYSASFQKYPPCGLDEAILRQQRSPNIQELWLKSAIPDKIRAHLVQEENFQFMSLNKVAFPLR
jgi:hypothetical protein